MPNGNPFDSSLRVMKAIASSRDESEDPESHQMPVFIPNEDRESVAKVIFDSPTNSIVKAKNLKSLKNFGYILDTSGLSGRKPQSLPAIEGFKKPKAEIETLKEDRPLNLKSKELKGSMEQVVEKLRGGQ